MKNLKRLTSSLLATEKETEITAWMLRIAIVLCLLVLNLCYMSAQTRERSGTAGISMRYLSSGNGHGTFYSPGLLLDFGRSQIEISALMHKRSGLTKGGRLTWSYSLTGSRYQFRDSYHFERFGLRFISYAQYNDPLPLS